MEDATSPTAAALLTAESVGMSFSTSPSVESSNLSTSSAIYFWLTADRKIKSTQYSKAHQGTGRNSTTALENSPGLEDQAHDLNRDAAVVACAPESLRRATLLPMTAARSAIRQDEHPRCSKQLKDLRLRMENYSGPCLRIVIVHATNKKASYPKWELIVLHTSLHLIGGYGESTAFQSISDDSFQVPHINIAYVS